MGQPKPASLVLATAHEMAATVDVEMVGGVELQGEAEELKCRMQRAERRMISFGAEVVAGAVVFDLEGMSWRGRFYL